MDNFAKIEMDKFFGSLRTSAEGYRYLSFRYFGIETADGLQLICATLRLELFAEGRGKSWHFRSGRIAAGYTQQPINFAAVKDLAEKVLATGELQIDGRTFRLAKEDGDRFSAFFRPFAAFPLPQGLKAPTLRISGGRRQPLFFDAAELDFELKASEQPYHGLGELLHAAGLPTQIPDQVWVDFYATVVVMVDDAKSCVKGTTAEIALLAPNTLDTDAVRLGWRCLQDNAVYDRLSIDGKGIRWTREGEQLHGEHKLDVQPRSVVQCFVSYHGCLQHEWWIADSSVIYNPRRAAHEAFDPKLERLEQLLFDRRYLKEDSRKFEEGVTYLLSMLGFRATRYDKPLADAPDIIASTAKGDFAVVECTTAAFDSAKLSKLVARTTAVRNQLAASSHQAKRVVPIIVTSLGRAEVGVDLEQAQKLGVVVVTAENLKAALPRTLIQADPHLDIYEDAFAELTVQGQLQLPPAE